MSCFLSLDYYCHHFCSHAIGTFRERAINYAFVFLFKCLLHTRGPDINPWKIKNNIYTVIKYLYKYYKIKK